MHKMILHYLTGGRCGGRPPVREKAGRLEIGSTTIRTHPLVAFELAESERSHAHVAYWLNRLLLHLNKVERDGLVRVDDVRHFVKTAMREG
jgi:hypothetical protein